MKYEITDFEKVMDNAFRVYRIRALRDIPLYGIKAGDLGGFIEDSLCLAQDGQAWVGDDAVVCGVSTHVTGDAWVCGNARVDRGSYIGGQARITGDARVLRSRVKGDSVLVTNRALVENSNISGNRITIEASAFLHNVHITKDALRVNIGGYARLVNDGDALKINGKDIRIEDNARLLNCRAISGSDIMLTEDCLLENSVTLEGKMIRASGVASVKGAIFVHDNVALSDCVHVYRSTNEIAEMLYEVNLSGDITGTADSFGGIDDFI